MGEKISQLQSLALHDKSVADLSQIADANQLSRTITNEQTKIMNGKPEESADRFRVLLDRAIVALTSPAGVFKLDDDFLPAIQSLCKQIRPDWVPNEYLGYFLNRLVTLLSANLDAERDNSTFRFDRIFFVPAVLCLLPIFYNGSVRQTKLYVGNMEVLPPETMRERVMALLSKKEFWNHKWAAIALEQVKSMDLTPKELDQVLRQVIQHVFTTDISNDAIVPIISAFLAFSLKKSGVSFSLIMSGIIKLFHRLEQQVRQDDFHETQTGTQTMRAIDAESLRQTENWIFSTLTQFFATNPKFSLDFIQMTHTSIAKGQVTLFSIGLLLVITGANDYDSKLADKAMECLMEWATSIKPTLNTHKQRYLNGMLVPPSLLPARPNFELRANEKLVDAAKLDAYPALSFVQLESCCVRGWLTCVNGLVALAFHLAKLDQDHSRGRISAPSKKKVGGNTAAPTISFFGRAAIELLDRIFNDFAFVRGKILDDLFLAMVADKAEHAAMHVEMVRSLLSVNRMHMAPFMNKFHEVAYQITYMPTNITKTLLRAFVPIFSLHPEFKDHLVMVLRKASFSHENTSRIVAVSGFIELLRAHVSALTEANALAPTAVETIALECLSFIRRSFSQQASIRAVLYQDLARTFIHLIKRRKAVLASLNGDTSSDHHPEARPLHYPPGTLEVLNVITMSIPELLHTQLSNIFTEKNGKLAFDLAQCFKPRSQMPKAVADKNGASPAIVQSSQELLEPLHILIMATNVTIMAECYPNNGLDLENSFTLPLKDFMDRFVEYILDTELEQYELDKSAEFSTDTPEGLANHDRANILLGLYECCIEYLTTVKVAALRLTSASQAKNKDKSQDKSQGMTESEQDREERMGQVHKLFKILIQLKLLAKDAKTVAAMKPPAKKEPAKQVAANDMDVDEEENGDAAKTKTPAKKTTTAVHASTTTRTSLFTRNCIANLLIILCNPIKAASRKDANGRAVATNASRLASDFATVQYVLHVALARTKSIAQGPSATITREETGMDGVIEVLTRSSDARPWMHDVSCFVLHEAALPPMRDQPITALPTTTLALEIYVAFIQAVAEQTDMNPRELAQFAACSMTYLISLEDAKAVVDADLSAEAKIAHFVELIRSFVTLDLCGERPHEAELFLSIISTLSPLLGQEQLRTIALWLETLIANPEGDVDARPTVRSELGLKIVPLIWALWDRCDSGDDVKTSYLMFSKDIFLIWGGNGASSDQAKFAEEDQELQENHCSTYSIVNNETVSDVAIALIDTIENRLDLIDALYSEITTSEKFVVVGDGEIEREASDDELPTPSRQKKSKKASASAMVIDTTQPEEEEEEDDHVAIPLNVHLQRKNVLYNDYQQMADILYCLSSTRMSNAASLVFSKLMEKALKNIHGWLQAMLKRKDFEPIIPSFEALIAALGHLFDRLRVWTTSWLGGNLPFLPAEEKKRQRLVTQARTAASKHVPQIVYWMEKIHAEDLIKLAAKADQPSLLEHFAVNSGTNTFVVSNGLVERMLSKKRPRQDVAPNPSPSPKKTATVKRQKKK